MLAMFALALYKIFEIPVANGLSCSCAALLKRRYHQDMTFEIPARVAASCRKTPEGAAWLDRLPETLGSVERRWSLTVGARFDALSENLVRVGAASHKKLLGGVGPLVRPRFAA
jgi:hypothetical protein